MTIYRHKRTSSEIYRNIYKQHHGSIPREENGRSYEIHHIDGDHTNNNINNLVAVTLQEHYDIHYANGDFRACQLMSAKLNKAPEEIKELHKLSIRKMIDDKTFNFCDGDIARRLNKRLLDDGTHIFQVNNPGPAVTKKRIEERTHNWVGSNHPNFDSTIYEFKHNVTNQIIFCTRDHLIKTYNLNKRNVSSMIKGRNYKSVGGWRLISTQN